MRELDCWEGLGSNRTSDQANVTRSKAVEYYGLGKRKRCQILGDSGHVVDAHIIPESKNTLLILVDLEPEDFIMTLNGRLIIRMSCLSSTQRRLHLP